MRLAKLDELANKEETVSGERGAVSGTLRMAKIQGLLRSTRVTKRSDTSYVKYQPKSWLSKIVLPDSNQLT